MSAIKWAAVFPGQGSQSVGMLDYLANEPVIQYTFQKATEILGYDLWQLIHQGPAETLNQTEYTQPALLAADVAIWEYLYTKQLPAPMILAGHSLGEFSALVCAGALSFEDGLRLVQARGRCMQAAVPVGEGAMGVVVQLPEEELLALCKTVGDVEPANYNSIGQTVVAGRKASVEKLLELVTEKGALLAKLLPMSVPSHCSLMAPAAFAFTEVLKTVSIQTPLIPVLHNKDVKPHAEPEAIKQALIDQLTHPVRWVETIQALISTGVEAIVEIGPGRVLQGLNKRIDPSVRHLNAGSEAGIQNIIEEIKVTC